MEDLLWSKPAGLRGKMKGGYVSSHEETWEWERPTADYATAYVYNFDMKDGEFGDIFLTSNNGALIRKA